MAEGNQLKVIERVEGGALGQITAAEVDRQIETAKRWPRMVPDAQKELRALALSTEDVAGSCVYTLERKEKGGGKKYIVGASVRFAELLVYCWGNLRFGARIVEEGREFVTAQGFCADLQRNTAGYGEVKRRIVDSNGNRFSIDMIGVTSGAACSIAFRNAVFDCIPEALWRPIFEEAKQKARGKGRLKERVDTAIAFFVKAGAEEAQIFPALGVAGRGDMTDDHLDILTGLRTALKDNLIPIERLFHPDAAEERRVIALRDESEDDFSGIDSKIKGTAKPDDKPPPKSRRAGKVAGPAGPSSGGDSTSPAKAVETPETGTSAASAGSGAAKAKPTKDESQLADIETTVKEARTGKRDIILEAREFLEGLEKAGGPFAARAKKLLDMFELPGRE